MTFEEGNRCERLLGCYIDISDILVNCYHEIGKTSKMIMNSIVQVLMRALANKRAPFPPENSI
jgi:hypothetical protein